MSAIDPSAFLADLHAEYVAAKEAVPAAVLRCAEAEIAFIAAQNIKLAAIQRETVARAAFARAIRDGAFVTETHAYRAFHVGTGSPIRSEDYRIQELPILNFGEELHFALTEAGRSALGSEVSA